MAAAPCLTLALTKGRILKATLPLLAAADIHPAEPIETSRKLIFATNRADLRLLIMRGADVTTYVRHGAADIGVAGKDMLLEHGTFNLYQPLDLEIAPCRLMTAAPVEATTHRRQRLRVATKFVNVAKRHYAERGIQIDLVQLYGGMELAPLVGLADEIVDIVDTGNTLRANGLEPRDLIADISSRLIVNKASLKLHYSTISQLIDSLHAAVANRQAHTQPSR